MKAVIQPASRPLAAVKPAPLLAAPVTLAVLAASLAAFLAPELSLALEYDRTRIAAGELWRILTGHWTHWTGEHLFWDAAMFLVLGAVLEKRDRFGFAACVIAAPVAISAGIWLLQPELQTYRGLSGLDTALFAMLSIGLLRASRCRLDLLLPLILLVGLLAKIAFELSTGATLFVNPHAVFVPVPLAHALGALSGVAVVTSRNKKLAAGSGEFSCE